MTCPNCKRDTCLSLAIDPAAWPSSDNLIAHAPVLSTALIDCLRATVSEERARSARLERELATLRDEVAFHAAEWSPEERTLAATMRAARSVRFDRDAALSRATAAEEVARGLGEALEREHRNHGPLRQCATCDLLAAWRKP